MAFATETSFRKGRREAAYAELPAHLRARAPFQAAARHSRFVKRLRKLLPLGCLLLVLVMVLRGILMLFIRDDAGFGLKSFTMEGRKLVMEKPHLSGFKHDGSSYEMTADKSVQDLKIPNMITLEGLKARIKTGHEGWAYLSSETGVYDTKNEILDVKGNVRMRTDNGTDVLLEDAHIVFKGSVITTQNHAEVRNTQGQVTADRMQVLDGGKRLLFEGNVRSVFTNATPAGPVSSEEVRTVPQTAPGLQPALSDQQ